MEPTRADLPEKITFRTFNREIGNKMLSSNLPCGGRSDFFMEICMVFTLIECKGKLKYLNKQNFEIIQNYVNVFIGAFSLGVVVSGLLLYLLGYGTI